ncbi:MAG: threonylcarbamoyl-AMP synthase [Gemmatimonadetes bacterium]|uniref:L-threonylcarbamoyladenylate synthase n=1 Tax=Candidatus Kutchimonas denitrificans TaxID=3056748 RepID=A0AAE4Z7G3_9BACT|nr:threonylcarbamoyl-AMP synthase [Gemmatimonadota bacterium]NIR75185.1 threonylcarbamoyl-AMP synthase [Candidatus Kutchimonas denitrificans]NIS00123.1 threonylcarbamoyl-AMP synthase [Gemmatimonadota bacterium]NIT65715.1 threonylcarbamoyl-AMP synthase [Gemmatimonadota bacterium]NIU52993.1 threonylcarbamoyl-AMP synthase [Gemmatimonadota bacterium]
MAVEIVPAVDAETSTSAADRAASVLAAGGLVVHPTETVYGIGGDASARSNRLIATIKGREAPQPLILLVPDLAALRAAYSGLVWSDEAETLARRFWPGPLTLVLRCPGAPAGVRGPGDGIAVRITANPVVRAVLERWRRPMTSTSANPSGGEPPRTLGEALDGLGARLEAAAEDGDTPVLAIDGGPTKAGRPSTIVSLVEPAPRLLREGPVTRRALEAELGQLS